MFRHMLVAAAAALSLSVPTTDAGAHVSLETREAPESSYYKAVLRVGHGCGESPTVRLRVRVPDGVTAVKPMPKPGWELGIVNGTLAKAVDDGHGKTVTEGVVEVTWTGRLLHAHYDEFVMRMKLPSAAAGTVLYFPVVQECEQGVHRWIEIPEPGKTAHDYKEPAPGLMLTGRK
jgi:periplasmic copper chaperone A